MEGKDGATRCAGRPSKTPNLRPKEANVMTFAEARSARTHESTQVAAGLDGIVVAETRLSSVDGHRGRLIIAGHPVAELVATHRFEDAAALLLGRTALAPAIGQGRLEAFERLGSLGGALDAGTAMAGLRGAIAQLDLRDDAQTPPRLVGAVAVYTCAWARRRRGLDPVRPDPDASHASDLLRMLSGETATTSRVRALDAYLTTVSDHGMNASTFAARVVASTRGDMVSAVTAALGALAGPLHGGAPGPVLDMLDAIGTADRARAWLQAELTGGQRIMGMGHRVYRVRDPRAEVLERVVRGLDACAPERLELARAVELEAERLLGERHPGRELRANVEFYTALLLEALDVPRELFTAVFASARVAGWCAHVLEQWQNGKLIRPLSRYVGRA
jgi:citrate synthase